MYKGYNKKTGEEVAIKKVSVKELKKQKERIESVLIEAEMLKEMNHPNIIWFLDLHEESDYLYITTELATLGTFKQLIS